MSCPRCGTPVPVINFNAQRGVTKCMGCGMQSMKRSDLPSARLTSSQIPLPSVVAGRKGCPICGAQITGNEITINDGGSILCAKCGSTFHRCVNGETRTGFTPMDCPYCAPKEGDMIRGRGDYLGNFNMGGKPQKKGDYVGDFFIGGSY